jgi:AraC-like DNA-binding protein
MGTDTSYVVDQGLAILITDLGISSANVLRRAHLPGDLFARAPVKLKPEAYFGLCEALEAESGDPNLPLQVGRAISVEVFSPPIFAAICSPNLNVAAPRIAKYKKLIGPLRMSVAQDTSETTLGLLWPGHLTPPRVLTMIELVFWVALARLATRTELKPLRVTAPEPPEDADAYRRYFGVAVQRGPSRQVTFSAEDAERPFLTANEPMWDFFEPELRRRLSEIEAGASTTERVRGALLELLPAGSATMEEVSRELAISSRTLQRKLQSEDTTFQAVLNETREALARHYLSRATIPTTEISFLLGYEDPNSFYRAFRSWTGQTPEQVRLAAA